MAFVHLGVGINYLDTTKKSIETDSEIKKIYDGILSVVHNKANHFYCDYPCHSPSEKRWFSLKATPLGKNGHVVITHTNITEEKIFQEKLIVSQTKFKNLFKKVSDAIVVLNEDGAIDEYNFAFNKLFNETKNDLYGKMLPEIVSTHPEDIEKSIRYNKNLKEKGSQKYEGRVYTQSGKLIWVDVSSSAIYDKNGKCIGSRDVIRDITEKKQGELKTETNNKITNVINHLLELSHSNVKLSVILEHALQHIIQLPFVNLLPKGAIFLADENENLNMIAHIGLCDTNIKNCSFIKKEDCFCGKVALNKEAIYAKCSSGSKQIELSAENEHDNYILPLMGYEKLIGILNLHLSPHQTLNENEVSILEAIAKTLGNIIRKKQIETDIIKSEERFRGVIENSKELTIIGSKRGTITFVSPSVPKFLGYSENELIGKNAFDFIHPEDQKIAYTRFYHQAPLHQEEDYQVYRLKTKSGAFKYIRGMVSLHFDNPGINGFIVNAQDISELVTSQKERLKLILQTEEKERQRIAHDLHDGLGQTIAAANMYINVLDQFAKEQFDEKTYSLFETCKQLINNSAIETRLVSHNIMPRSLKEFGIDQTISEMIHNYQKISPEIQFETFSEIKNKRFPEDVELTLYRSVQEIINNALKHANASRIKIKLTMKSAQLKIEIADNGIGFNIKKLKTKQVKGLGLVSIPERINAINGDFLISSNKKTGTSAIIIIKL